ncbi:hypothetical protein [Anaerosinus massiliensis]|uniref:hypothetical protein n=1 Tax=Massilibacillus massiliensis TaxID=1806837 RepID=UPI0018FE1779|nr:hypothetical protein [Massilibacillus massiliensis]
MLKQFLAQYLLNKNLLSSEQVLEILEDDEFQRVSPGVVALHMGLMTAKQIEKVQKIQIDHDKLFGEAAMDAGLLTEDQVGAVLAAREDNNLSVAQAILSLGFMTLEELENTLAEYRKQNQFSLADSFKKMEFGNICCTDFEEIRELYIEYVELFLQALEQFAELDGVIIPATALGGKGKWLISQKMNGDVALGTGVLLAEPVVLHLAKRYSKEEDINTVDQLALDSVSEFLNVVNGLFIVALSNKNIDVDLEPQKFGEGVIPVGSKQAVIHIDTKIGLIQLILAVDGIQ